MGHRPATRPSIVVEREESYKLAAKVKVERKKATCKEGVFEQAMSVVMDKVAKINDESEKKLFTPEVICFMPYVHHVHAYTQHGQSMAAHHHKHRDAANV